MLLASATFAILTTASLSSASSSSVPVVNHRNPPFQPQHTLSPHPSPQTPHEHHNYQHLTPTILLPIKESHRHHPFTSTTSGRVYFSGDKSTKDEERMLVSFRIPPHDDGESVGKCFLSFFRKAGIRGRGKMHAYKLREEIFIGKTTYHGRPRREFGGIVFGIEVPVEGGYADVSGPGVQCAPGETVTFEIVPDREVGVVDVCWNQEAKEEDKQFVKSGIGLWVVGGEWFGPEEY